MILEKKSLLKIPFLDYIRYKQLNWYVQVQKMNKERLPQKIQAWCPSGKSRKGRPRNSWMQEVTTEIREKGINNLESVDRKNGGEKFKIYYI